MVRQRGERRRADEALGGARHHDTDAGAAEPQQAHEDAGFVRGDAAGDAEQNAATPQDGTLARRRVLPLPAPCGAPG